MKNASVAFTAAVMLCAFACKKSASSADQISLSASTTEATVGQTVAVTVSSSANASRWTVSPSTASKTYTVTTARINYITFTQPGVYTVSVSAKSLRYDSAHQSLDSLFNHTNVHTCTKGVDSASVKIAVTK